MFEPNGGLEMPQNQEFCLWKVCENVSVDLVFLLFWLHQIWSEIGKGYLDGSLEKSSSRKAHYEKGECGSFNWTERHLFRDALIYLLSSFLSLVSLFFVLIFIVSI